MRKCCLCGDTHKLVDVYRTKEIKNYATGNNVKAVLPTPIVYCEACFMANRWKK